MVRGRRARLQRARVGGAAWERPCLFHYRLSVVAGVVAECAARRAQAQPGRCWQPAAAGPRAKAPVARSLPTAQHRAPSYQQPLTPHTACLQPLSPRPPRLHVRRRHCMRLLCWGLTPKGPTPGGETRRGRSSPDPPMMPFCKSGPTRPSLLRDHTYCNRALPAPRLGQTRAVPGGQLPRPNLFFLRLTPLRSSVCGAALGARALIPCGTYNSVRSSAFACEYHAHSRACLRRLFFTHALTHTQALQLSHTLP